MFKKKRLYGVYNIEYGSFSFDEEERLLYRADIQYTHSGLAYYKIEATWLQYLKLRICFWFMRQTVGYKVMIKRLT